MIQERRPHLNGMRHAGVVHFRQDIIRKKVFLVEPKISRQGIARVSQLFQNGIERRPNRFVRTEAICFANRALIRCPGEVPLIEAQHRLGQSQGKMRIRAAAQSPKSKTPENRK